MAISVILWQSITGGPHGPPVAPKKVAFKRGSIALGAFAHLWRQQKPGVTEVVIVSTCNDGGCTGAGSPPTGAELVRSGSNGKHNGNNS